MARVPLTLAIRDYAHVAPLALGDVTIEGVDLTLRRVFDAPQQVLADPAIDGGEASFSRHLQRVAARDDAFVGLPAFVMRGFRHRCIFVRHGSPLATLSDLVGRRVGLNEWGATGQYLDPCRVSRARDRPCGCSLVRRTAQSECVAGTWDGVPVIR